MKSVTSQYFVLRGASDPKVIGVRNGISQGDILPGDTEDEKTSYQKLFEFFDYRTYWNKGASAPPDNLSIRLYLLKNAKLTDFLSFSPFLMACPFIVNDKVRDILSNMVIQEHYFIPIKVNLLNTPVSENYYLLYLPLLDYDVIDFENSTFFEGLYTDYFRKTDDLQFSSSVELQKAGLIKPRKLSLYKGFDRKLDLFHIRLIEPVISKRLMIELSTNKITGLNMVPSPVDFLFQ